MLNITNTLKQVKKGNLVSNTLASIALIGVLSQPASAYSAKYEESCSIQKNVTAKVINGDIDTSELQISCEGGIAYTYTKVYKAGGKSVKYNREGEPQKCKCIYVYKKKGGFFSNQKTERVFSDIDLKE